MLKRAIINTNKKVDNTVDVDFHRVKPDTISQFNNENKEGRTMSIYKITVNGELLDGQELEQVKQRFSKLFDLDSEPVKYF
ncbi:MAG: hypothetical protein L3J70_10670 [Gammaproteobacteria bacterium]|nr:hypothetical protein [Gammaproteobacteria bacterium]